MVEPPTPNQGARRVWSDSQSRIWVSEWNSGNVSVHDPADGSWKTWKLPGERPRTYAVYVDDKDKVWLTDFARQCHRPLRSRDRAVQRFRQRQGRTPMCASSTAARASYGAASPATTGWS